MIRPARPDDLGAIERFLASHAATSMFLRSNLAAHGLGVSNHSHAMTCWLIEGENNTVSGIFARTNGGFLLAQAPAANADHWRAFSRRLAGYRICGMTGPDDQVLAALDALALEKSAFSLNAAEPLYHLALQDVKGDETTLREARHEDVPLLTEWFSTYFQETGSGGDAIQTAQQAKMRAWAAVGSPDLRLMIEGGTPVAMAAVNARAGDMIQIGGVFVPPSHRNRGLGRQVTAALLSAEHSKGMREAILFAASSAAVRAYEALGFTRIGTYRVAVLKAPLTLGSPCP